MIGTGNWGTLCLPTLPANPALERMVLHRDWQAVDINLDGWKDIYVANDFFTSDELILITHDGTFSNQLDVYFKHTAQNAMGLDIADINNDGLADIVSVDMNPEDNFRKKKEHEQRQLLCISEHGKWKLRPAIHRNTLQLNQEPSFAGT